MKATINTTEIIECATFIKVTILPEHGRSGTIPTKITASSSPLKINKLILKQTENKACKSG